MEWNELNMIIWRCCISDLNVVSSELYDKFARLNCIDKAIFDSEQEIANGAEVVDVEVVFV